MLGRLEVLLEDQHQLSVTFQRLRIPPGQPKIACASYMVPSESYQHFVEHSRGSVKQDNANLMKKRRARALIRSRLGTRHRKSHVTLLDRLVGPLSKLLRKEEGTKDHTKPRQKSALAAVSQYRSKIVNPAQGQLTGRHPCPAGQLLGRTLPRIE